MRLMAGTPTEALAHSATNAKSPTAERDDGCRDAGNAGRHMPTRTDVRRRSALARDAMYTGRRSRRPVVPGECEIPDDGEDADRSPGGAWHIGG